MKAANRAIRLKDHAKGDAKLRELGFNDAGITTLREPDFCGRLGFPDYEIKNNGANLRRLKNRVEELKAKADDETTEREVNGVTVVDNVEENRLQLFFPGKPSEEVRKALKGYGFRWARSVGAWQLHRSYAANCKAEAVLKLLEEEA